MQIYINNLEISSNDIFYDEHFYRKYIEGKEIHPVEISIELQDFNEKMKPQYQELLRELIEDDEKMGENYALELFETLAEYPSYEDILNTTRIDMKEKMNFLDTFFLSQIFKEFLWHGHSISGISWVIKEVFYFNKIGDTIVMKGNTQKIN
ncbi:hypothetical protein SAMN05443633_104339 [Chryseobacterium arachidis]|uniref:Uncharacterized protein n=1 Tax=Chryseobacterium arachidis TaxID=1416778 RepID=A0A1M5BYX9_9FLAO|nr:hypothetical protein [Chryseobacterium arachidis]SHF47610.1 hypothetical protein SAMN05443633_104339 [Chryseobacterium arachidis]